jgi:Peptidase M1 N-terminal domain
MRVSRGALAALLLAELKASPSQSAAFLAGVGTTTTASFAMSRSCCSGSRRVGSAAMVISVGANALLTSSSSSAAAAAAASSASLGGRRRHHQSHGRASSSSSAVVLDAVGRALWQQSPFQHVPRGGGGGGGASSSSSAFSTKSVRTMATTTALTSAVAEQALDTEAPKKEPTEIFRNDYQPLPYTVSNVRMDINVREGRTTVATELVLIKNPSYGSSNDQAPASEELVLDGDESAVKLLELQMNGKRLVENEDYRLEPGRLILKRPTDGAVLKTVVEIVPETNTQLSGLYRSGAMYCTQCEAQGFRRITYYPDRPDNMAVFDRVRLEADKGSYPVLLSNGNLLEQGSVKDDPSRHYAVWSDPFPKPSYLFAAVIGKLDKISDTYVTKSGRTVDLQLFSEPSNVNKLQYALDSLKRSMKWDEDRFNLEYDLDQYNIVAVESFNMGVRSCHRME